VSFFALEATNSREQHAVDEPFVMGGPQPGVEEERVNRGACSLGKRDGDDLKTAIYTCAGCSATLRGFTGWRNHMKKATKFNKKSGAAPPAKAAAPAAPPAVAAHGSRLSNASTNPRPEEEAAPTTATPKARAAEPRRPERKERPALEAAAVLPKPQKRAAAAADAAAAPSKPQKRAAAEDGASATDEAGKKKRVRGPRNDARRLAHAEKVRTREAQ